MSGTIALVGLLVVIAALALIVATRAMGILRSQRKVDDVGSIAYGSGGGESSSIGHCGSDAGGGDGCGGGD